MCISSLEKIKKVRKPLKYKKIIPIYNMSSQVGTKENNLFINEKSIFNLLFEVNEMIYE